MKAQCENLKASLDGELSLLDRLKMRIHLRSCSVCRDNASAYRHLMVDISIVDDIPVSQSLKDKVIADAESTAETVRIHGNQSQSPRVLIQGVLTMKRALVALLIIVPIIAAGLYLLPSGKHNMALADIMHAMSSVKSMHMVGWKIDSPDGGKHKVELWIKNGNMLKLESMNETAVDDGEKLVIINKDNSGEIMVTIRRPGDLPEIEKGESYIDMFVGENFLKQLMHLNNLGIAGSRFADLPDGRNVAIIELRSGPAKSILTVDTKTNLIYKLEMYGDNGDLGLDYDTFEYDVDIPDSIFTAEIPSDAVVNDIRVPVPDDRKRWKEDMAQKLGDAGGIMQGKIPSGTCGTQFHTELRFKCMSSDGIMVYYFPKRNAYYILGKALVTDGKSNFRQIVEDGEFTAPYKADSAPPEPVVYQPTLEDKAWDAMFEKSRPAGSDLICKLDGIGWTCGSKHPGLRFHGVGGRVGISYLPDEDVYRIVGRVEVYYPNGKKEIVEDTDIKAP